MFCHSAYIHILQIVIFVLHVSQFFMNFNILPTCLLPCYQTHFRFVIKRKLSHNRKYSYVYLRVCVCVCVCVCVAHDYRKNRALQWSVYRRRPKLQKDEEICVMASDDWCCIADITTAITRSTLRLVGEKTCVGEINNTHKIL